MKEREEEENIVYQLSPHVSSAHASLIYIHVFGKVQDQSPVTPYPHLHLLVAPNRRVSRAM